MSSGAGISRSSLRPLFTCRDWVTIVFQRASSPLIAVYPGYAAVSAMTAVPADVPLTHDAVHHTRAADGRQFIYVTAAAHDTAGPRDLQIISGRLLTRRARLLRDTGISYCSMFRLQRPSSRCSVSA